MMNQYKDFWYNLSDTDKKKCMICVSELIYNDCIGQRKQINTSLKDSFGITSAVTEQEFIDLQYFISVYMHLQAALERIEDRAMI